MIDLFDGGFGDHRDFDEKDVVFVTMQIRDKPPGELSERDFKIIPIQVGRLSRSQRNESVYSNRLDARDDIRAYVRDDQQVNYMYASVHRLANDVIGAFGCRTAAASMTDALYALKDKHRVRLQKADMALNREFTAYLSKLDRVLKRHGIAVNTGGTYIEMQESGSDGTKVYGEIRFDLTNYTDPRDFADFMRDNFDVWGIRSHSNVWDFSEN